MEIGIDSFAAFLPEAKHQAFVPASQKYCRPSGKGAVARFSAGMR
jgi:hypothetical protein